MKTIVAFANSAGGTIIIGAKDKTKVLVGLLEILFEKEWLIYVVARGQVGFKPVIACKSTITRRRWMADFSDFDEGNVSYIPEAKDEKDDIQLSDE